MRWWCACSDYTALNPYPGGSEFSRRGESDMRYTWKVIHEVVGKLEEALNGLQKDGFEVYRILPAGESGTALEMGIGFVVVGRKELVTPIR